MSYPGHADVAFNPKIEAIRQSVVEIEHAQRLRARQAILHVVAIAVLSVVLFGVVVALISL